jgi:hypothetical protein
MSNSNYNRAAMLGIMQATMRILEHGGGLSFDQANSSWEYKCPPRAWFRDLTQRFEFHPAVWHAVELARPLNWQLLVLEYPHKAETDVNRIAYTRDERSGEANRQTLTTIGKYLMRHFDLPDHEIRDIVARYTSKGEMYFVHTVDEMVHVVNNGPHSCMKWSNRGGVNCDDGIRRHPYAVYAPKYGWHMAVRKDGDEIVGRALCISNDDGKYWVRSFKKGESYSYTDEMLEAWLKGQDYKHESGYIEGQKIAKIPANCGYLAPYIDGDQQDVSDGGDHLFIEERGEYTFNETQGYVSDGNDKVECEDCGDMVDEDEYSYVGADEDRCVCHRCMENNYVYARGRRGQHFYVSNDDVVYVESQDEHYDINYLSTNSIVDLDNGDYEHIDNAVCVDDAWYHIEDERVVCDHQGDYQLRENCSQLHDGEWALDDECWYCEGSQEYYLYEDEDPVYVDGDMYHPDHVPTSEENQGE